MKRLKDPEGFAHRLCGWYREHRRELPFRKTKDPYRIFISELMLQQTQVTTMLPYYERFIERFPDVHALAAADRETVLKLWEGLGYYNRARHLHEAARHVVEIHGGAFPEDFEELLTLKGVGRYTAAAIRSIAFERPSPAVDGNVMRVMCRVLAYDADPTKVSERKRIESVLTDAIVHEVPSDFTQGMMELGALICRPDPACEKCPLRDCCFAYEQGIQRTLPRRPKRKSKPVETYHVFIYGDGRRFLFMRRPESGLLGGLDGLPQYGGTLKQALAAFAQDYEVRVGSHEHLGNVRHTFSHKQWLLKVHQVFGQGGEHHLKQPGSSGTAMPRAHSKVLELFQKQNGTFA